MHDPLLSDPSHSPAKKLLLAAAVALFALVSAQSRAQPDPPMEAGRLSYISGTVSFQPAGIDDWGQAQQNLPLGPGDRIFTDSDGRAEIEIGDTFLRIGPNSDVSLVEDDPGSISIGVAQGSVHVHCNSLLFSQALHITTPNGAITFDQPGDARVEVMPDQNIAIFTGFYRDQMVTGANGFNIGFGPGETLELAGTNPVQPQFLSPGPPDGLDIWSQQRDQQIAAAASWRYVSHEVPGAEELDANGSWMPGTPYGAVWFPNVQQGWAPYHNGHWVNHAPWGPVWVEDESWGYAPFHYGRWVVFQGRWGWIPGPVQAHPVWSPALVVFGGGIQVEGVAVSAWFPLGPGEPYRPWYPCSPQYVDRVNISNMSEGPRVHVLTTYVGFNFGGIAFANRSSGITAVRQADFAAGRPVRQTNVVVNVNVVQNITIIQRPVVEISQRTIIERAPSRPVPVTAARPTLINEKGMEVSAQQGFRPAPPPVKQPVQVKTLPGRQIVAPPAGVKMPPSTAAAPGRPAPPQPVGPERTAPVTMPDRNAPTNSAPGATAPARNPENPQYRQAAPVESAPPAAAPKAPPAPAAPPKPAGQPPQTPQDRPYSQPQERPAPQTPQDRPYSQPQERSAPPPQGNQPGPGQPQGRPVPPPQQRPAAPPEKTTTPPPGQPQNGARPDDKQNGQHGGKPDDKDKKDDRKDDKKDDKPQN